MDGLFGGTKLAVEPGELPVVGAQTKARLLRQGQIQRRIAGITAVVGRGISVACLAIGSQPQMWAGIGRDWLSGDRVTRLAQPASVSGDGWYDRLRCVAGES